MQYHWPSVCFSIFIIVILKPIPKTEIVLMNEYRIWAVIGVHQLPAAATI